MQMVFQNPVGSLNPRMTILENVAEPLVAHGRHKNARAAEKDVAALMDRVGLRPGMMSRYPNQFSGGQCQRVGIARALAIDPDFIVADEPVSSLDVSIQAQIVNLLADLRRERGLTMLFIAHDLAVVRHIADRVATMYAGEIVEVADSQPLYERPFHPYTDELLAAIPLPVYPRRPSTTTRHNAGASPELTHPPEGCVFASRCRFAQDRCRGEKPLLRTIAPGRLAACHFAEDLDLHGSKQRAS
jgi:oligopeptide/dipeptide ABC transporter ATP-binding protein